MNCREAQPQILTERDGALEISQRTALDGHLAQCDACRRIRDNLAAALTGWQLEATRVTVPDAEREWHAVRRRIRGGQSAGAKPASRGRATVWPWLTVPLGAGAAVAIAFWISSSSPQPAIQPDNAVQHIARANSVDAPGNDASTTVFVDDKSGWLIVWASDANPKRG